MNGYTCVRCGTWVNIGSIHVRCLSVQPIQYATPPVALTPICNCASEISELRKAVEKLTQELATWSPKAVKANKSAANPPEDPREKGDIDAN